MNTKEMIEVMQAFEDGADIEFKDNVMPEWVHNGRPSWDWGQYYYRIKPAETLEDRVKAEYGDFKIIMLFWAQSVSRSRDQLQMVGCTNPHYVAQSTKGFYQYCYEKKGGGFYLLSSPIGNAAAQPVAVLFLRGEG